MQDYVSGTPQQREASEACLPGEKIKRAQLLVKAALKQGGAETCHSRSHRILFLCAAKGFVFLGAGFELCSKMLQNAETKTGYNEAQG